MEVDLWFGIEISIKETCSYSKIYVQLSNDNPYDDMENNNQCGLDSEDRGTEKN